MARSNSAGFCSASAARASADAAGLAYIRHIAATPTDLLHLLVGRMAPALKSYADGIDDLDETLALIDTTLKHTQPCGGSKI